MGHALAKLAIEMLKYIQYTSERDITSELIQRLPAEKEALMMYGEKMIEKGRQEERLQNMQQVAESLFEKNMDINDIQEVTGLNRKQLSEIRKKTSS